MGVKHSRNSFSPENGIDALKDISCSNGFGGVEQLIGPNRYGYPMFNGYHHPMPPNEMISSGMNYFGDMNNLSTRIPKKDSADPNNNPSYGLFSRNINESVGFKRISGGQMNKKDATRNSFFNSSNAPTKSALFQELLECPICMNLYDNPLVLPCQHTFCKKCIVSLQGMDSDNAANTNNNNNNNNNNSSSNGVNNSNSNNVNHKINCPICREAHNLANGIDGLSANYTMKRLIELESMASEKEKAKANKEKAKCILCQKFDHLNICHDCSYMLCVECLDDPDHELKIDLKVKSKIKPTNESNYIINYKDQPRLAHPLNDYVSDKIYVDRSQFTKLKLILLCHSSAVEASMDKPIINNNNNSIDLLTGDRISASKFDTYEDEYGKCSTFSKVGIPANDRVITLKKIIETKFGISCNDQILVYKDNVLKNDLKPLSFYRLRQYSRIHIFDQRDIKESTSDDDLFGIYQDASINTLVDTSNNVNPVVGKAANNKLDEHDEEESLRENVSSMSQNKRISSASASKYARSSLYKQPKYHHSESYFKHSMDKSSAKLRYQKSHLKTPRKHHSKSDESNESCEYEEEFLIDTNKMISSRKKIDSYHLTAINKQSAAVLMPKKHADPAVMSRVRRLDEIFDQKLSINE